MISRVTRDTVTVNPALWNGLSGIPNLTSFVYSPIYDVSQYDKITFRPISANYSSLNFEIQASLDGINWHKHSYWDPPLVTTTPSPADWEHTNTAEYTFCFNQTWPFQGKFMRFEIRGVNNDLYGAANWNMTYELEYEQISK